jgi:hypothetical protein
MIVINGFTCVNVDHGLDAHFFLSGELADRGSRSTFCLVVRDILADSLPPRADCLEEHLQEFRGEVIPQHGEEACAIADEVVGWLCGARSNHCHDGKALQEFTEQCCHDSVNCACACDYRITERTMYLSYCPILLPRKKAKYLCRFNLYNKQTAKCRLIGGFTGRV